MAVGFGVRVLGFRGLPVALEGAGGGGRLRGGQWAGGVEHPVGHSQRGGEKSVVSILRLGIRAKETTALADGWWVAQSTVARVVSGTTSSSDSVGQGW